jgi:predicted amidohydrolase YtcJ
LYVTAIKIYADGALGSRGAALLKEYSDQPGYHGLILSPLDEMRKIATDAKGHNWQLCTHAIGDSANRAILRLYAEILKGKNDLRWRIEHAQVVDNEDYILFNNYSIIPSVQPTHAISDMPWAPERLGNERLPTAYAFKRLLKEAGTIALGTDFPVEEIDPLATFYTAVARKDKDGNPKNGFMKENALSRMEALKGMTIWAAHSVFRETETGSLEKGKHADLVILDKDIMKVEEKDILSARVLYTIQRGEIKYDATKK